MEPMRLTVLGLLIALGATACGDDDGAGTLDGAVLPRDGSTPGDAGSPGSDASAGVDGGDGTDGGAGADGGAPPPDAGTLGPSPTIPEPDGPCPTFTSGSQTIAGLETDILAGTPGATPGPILFLWHGTGGSGRVALNFQLPRAIRDDIEDQGGLVIAPNDDGTAREGYSPNGVWYETSDLEYADHIVACAVRNHNVDPRRIYVTGCSAGGLMASAMAVKRSSYVAAAFPNSGGLVSTMGVALEDPMHVPVVLTMHGGAGDTVVVNFQTTSERLLDFLVAEGGFAVDCNHMSGHCGAPSELQIRAWEMMEAHPFGTDPSPYAGGLPPELPDYCTIW